MKLTSEKIFEISKGAVWVDENDGMTELHRFTKEQEEIYIKMKPIAAPKRFWPAGIRLVFKTDSSSLFIKAVMSEATLRRFFSFDVFVDGKPIGYLDNFTGREIPTDYTLTEFPDGEFEKKFDLGGGVKTVTVHLPWSMRVQIAEISVDDGAFVEAVPGNGKKILFYGDSITQGYDAMRPSNRYAGKVADMLGYEEFNKGRGGEIYFPELAEYKDDFVPECIVVAYGTNDWGKVASDDFEDRCRRLYAAFEKNYPDTKVFAVTPLWRKDMNEDRVFGRFESVAEMMASAVKDFKNVILIDGFDFIPKEEQYYSDLRLHPNDKGFVYHANALYNEIAKYL